MNNVQFDENYTNPNLIRRENSEKGLTNWLVKKGLVKNKKSAEYLLILLTIVFFILSFIIGF